MTLRHTAALALTGWYLILPPVVGDSGSKHLDLHAPVSKWRRSVAPFSSESKCERDRAGLIEIAKKHPDGAVKLELQNADGTVSTRIIKPTLSQALLNSKCFEFDGPLQVVE